jgi:hypothetical protein
MTDDTELLRQVHPTFIQMDRVSSQAFEPTAKDNNRLSVYDGDQVNPEDAWNHFCAQPNCQSAGVLAVTVNECKGLGLTAEADPEPFPEHAVIDFGETAKNQVKKKARSLREIALARGWRFRDGEPSGN